MQPIVEPRPLRVAILCEYSGVVRNAFIAAGRFAVSFDVLPSDSSHGPHVQGDVMALPREFWEQFDLAVCHPPCTFLANSGVRWLYRNGRLENGRDDHRWEQMRQGAEFFRWVLNLPVPHLAIENPVMHRHAQRIVGRKPAQVTQPWMFGHPETKATALWLVNLPLLVETNNVRAEMIRLPRKERERVHFMSPGADRGLLRARTLAGIADAMAGQWGGYVASVTQTNATEEKQKQYGGTNG